jgi:hypothetical protein
MPNTYVLLSSTVLGSSQTSVTFSSIPQTYTDLLIDISARGNRQVQGDPLEMTINGVASGYGYTTLYQVSGGVSSGRGSADSRFYIDPLIPQQFTTANSFSNIEIYIPNYTVTGASRPLSIDGVLAHNSTVNYTIAAAAGLSTSTAAVTSVTFQGNGYIAGSSFHLYGIKNS